MSQYQWVIESPEDADGVSTTIVLGFGDDSDGDRDPRRPRQRHGSQVPRYQDDEQLVWWAGNNNNNNNGMSNSGRTARSEGGSSRRSKASSNRRSHRGPGSSAGTSSIGAGFGQHNGNGRRGSHRGTGTPIFTSTYFPENDVEANEEETTAAREAVSSPSSTYRAGPSSARTGGTRTSGSSRSSGGSVAGVFTLSPAAEDMAHVHAMATTASTPTAATTATPQPTGSATVHNKKLSKKMATQPIADGSHRNGPERTRRFRPSARMVPTMVTTVGFADDDSDDSGYEVLHGDDGDDNDHHTDMSASTCTTHIILHAPDITSDEELAIEFEDEGDDRPSRTQNGSDFDRYRRRRSLTTQGQDSADFTATVASLATQAHQMRHHLEAVHTPPLAPRKGHELPTHESARGKRQPGALPSSTLSASVMPAPSTLPPTFASRSNGSSTGLFSSQRPQPRVPARQTAPTAHVSSYFISPIHQSVAEEASDWAGTPYFFLGDGGGLAGKTPRAANSAGNGCVNSVGGGSSGLSQKELREREAAMEAVRGFDLSALDSHCRDRSTSGSMAKDDDTYDSSTEDMRHDGLTLSGCRGRWQLNTSSDRTPCASPRPAMFAAAVAGTPATAASRKRTRGGGRRDDISSVDDHAMGACTSGQAGGLMTSSDDDEDEALLRRVKRRRLQLVGTEECGGSKVLGPVGEPALLPPDMSLQLPSSRAETREDLLKSFFMGQALQEDDFRLY